MKTAIYIEDGITQIVLTPEGKFEEDIVKQLEQKQAEVSVKYGQFYPCAGGWTRHMDNPGNDRSVILALSEKAKGTES